LSDEGRRIPEPEPEPEPGKATAGRHGGRKEGREGGWEVDLGGVEQKDALGYGLFGARSHRKCLFRNSLVFSAQFLLDILVFRN